MKPVSRFLRFLAAGLLGVGLSGVAAASEFPTQPLRVVIPYPAGGTSDILGRMLQAPLAAAAGQAVVVENRPGGASVIGTSQVARATADGHTILLADLALLVNPSLKNDLPYDTTRDFRAVTALAKAPLVMLVNPSVQANSLKELMDLARSKPGALNFGSGGNATSTHMAGELFKKSTGLDIVHVPYQGVAPAMTAVLGGQVQIYFGGTTTAQQHLKSGRLKALAVTGDKRNPLLPDVPTFKELGVEGMNADTFWGAYVPAGVDAERVRILNAHFQKALADPAVKARAAELGLELIGNSPQQQQQEFVSMVQYWRDFTRSAGIKLD